MIKTVDVDKLTEETNKKVSDAYLQGFNDGIVNSALPIIERYYIATMLALHDLFHFGEDRCLRTINQIELNLIECITDAELCEKTMNALHIDIDMQEGINRAQPQSREKRADVRKQIKEEKAAEEEKKRQEEIKRQAKKERRKKNRQNRQKRRH